MYIVAPLVTCQSCIGVSRSGLRWPCRSAASEPSETGAKGGRKRVVPTSSKGLPTAAAMIAMPETLDVLPWSVAMPSVV